VFCGQTGEPIWPQEPTAWFRQHCPALGLSEIGVHGLPQTAATWVVARGESPVLDSSASATPTSV
jgi:hypothetical protein